MELGPFDRLVRLVHVGALVGFWGAVVEHWLVVLVYMEVEVEVGAERVGSHRKGLRQMDATEIAHSYIVAHWYS
jgi:hypothetical protein